MSKTILIADDSESIRELLEMTLVKEGYQVIKTEDGAVALSQLNGQNIDLIITDLNMPNMDGIELIRQVRKTDRYSMTPVIFLTTESQAGKKEEARLAGATGWIVKPFMPEKLLSVVQKVIR